MAGHSHQHRPTGNVHVGRWPRAVVLTGLAITAAATIVGLWILWPHADERADLPSASDYSAPGVTSPHGVVTQVQRACRPVRPQDGAPGPDLQYRPSDDCGNIVVELENRARPVTVQVPPEVSRSGLQAGDRVQLLRTPATAGQPAQFGYYGTERHVQLLWLFGAFVLLVLVVARLRGFLAMVTLAFGAFVVIRFMLPALLAGEPGLWVAVVGSSTIMFVVLYVTHGPSMRTSAALAGTLLGIAVAGTVGHLAIASSRLTGIADEDGGLLSSFVPELSFPGLLTCGLILAGLGILNDVTITQSSAVWELRAAAPGLSRRQLFTSAMRIGRDHIASTVYTVVFAYTGTSLLVLMLLGIYDRPFLELISSEDLAEEIVRTLSSAIGLVLAMPITTAIATAVVPPARVSSRPEAPVPDDDRSTYQRFWS